MKSTVSTRRSAGRASMAGRYDSGFPAPACARCTVSGSHSHAIAAATNVSAAAAQMGAVMLTCASMPLSAGPMMKPRPNAAPISPYALARSFGSVTSATYARAVEMFPPDSPSTMRARKSMAMLCAIASITKLTTVPTRLKIRIGRRPQRSDRSPSTGAASSWQNEKMANRKPISIGEAWNVSA